MSYDSITNRGEFFSNHYLDAIIGGDLSDLRRRWEEEEKAHQETGRSRLKALAKLFFAARATATEAGSDGAASRATSELNGHVLRALGLTVDRRSLTLTDTTTDELDVPVAATVETGSGLHLVALEAELADDVDDLFASGEGEQGRLVDPVHKVGEKLELVDPADAVSALFAVDDPPRWVLVAAGGIVLLAERAKWAEGRFLAVDLDTALERNDTSAKGELETVAALFSTDALVPRDGQAVIDQLADNSTKHAVGVSKELREGIRHSIEILANEVIQRRLKKNLGVYTGDNRIDPRDLTTQCLRYLYRLLVLLYAESRPELGIVPVDDEVYIAGYSLDRLRELTLTDLDTDGSRSGTHLDQSLRSLFELVNEGYHAENVTVEMLFEAEEPEHVHSYEDYLQFPGLDAQLFAPSAVPLVDSVTLRNEPLQKILQLLMLSPEGKGKRADRGFISYAQLGINQLGAVYEGLMAYTGFFADEDLYEVAKNGDPSDGTWVLPVGKADEYPEEVFVTREDPLTGTEERILHEKGAFVFRLSGRDRQRSASYYTPEVLTRCVVKHALAELLGTDDYAPENGSSGITEARQILDLTICEPALGSGAFLNEAINQLSAEYLRRRQAELGETLDPEQYNRELQKVKAHFALHQSYGVDLNATAVELAEVSLWLNCMHPGLKAPWFGMQLRQGNSLAGCRRATWKASQLADKPWAKRQKGDLRPPVVRPLSEKLADDEVHHFLLPGHGWAAVADRKEAKELRPHEAKALSDWRKAIFRAPSAKDAEQLQALTAGVEHLWAAATERLRLAQKSLRRPIEVWGAGKMAASNPGDRRRVIEALEHPDSELSRLRLVMDAWVGLWFWELDADLEPPTWRQWLAALEDLIGPERAMPGAGQLDLFDDLDALLEADQQRASSRPSTSDILERNPWLQTTSKLARNEGAWHWELEFAPALAAGGFDLIVGNPPWVGLSWDAQIVLAERIPAFGLGLRSVSQADMESAEGEALTDLCRELSSTAGALASLSATHRAAPLVGLRNNLYLNFILVAQDLVVGSGVAGLLHQDVHLTDPDGSSMRRIYWSRLRRRAHFRNELKLFEDVKNNTSFSLNVYGKENHDVRAFAASWILHPAVLDESMNDSGKAALPGIKTEQGGWDLRPHQGRVLPIDRAVLRQFRDLAADRGEDLEARLLLPVLRQELTALGSLAACERMASLPYDFSNGVQTKMAIRDGWLSAEQGRASDPSQLVLMAGHLTPAAVGMQEPNRPFRSNRDWVARPLPSVEVVSNFTFIQGSRSEGVRRGAPVEQDGSQLAFRRRADEAGERLLQVALLPAACLHTDGVQSVRFPNSLALCVVAGCLMSIPVEYVARLLGKGDMRENVFRILPRINSGNPLAHPLSHRVLRLSICHPQMEQLWVETYRPGWASETWATGEELGTSASGVWSSDLLWTREDVRRRAQVEMDALVALGLGVAVDELVAMYRTQFPVLRKYEYAMAFDAEGRKICAHHQSAGYRQSALQQQAKDGQIAAEWRSIWKLYEQWEEDPDSVDWMGYYTPPFYRPDREAEMTAAYNEFQRRLEVGFYGEVNEGASA